MSESNKRHHCTPAMGKERSDPNSPRASTSDPPALSAKSQHPDAPNPFAQSSFKIPLPLSQRTPLTARTGRLKALSTGIGKFQIIQTNGPLETQAGFHCELCRAVFTSSDAYLDHMNSRLHQKNEGKSMKAETVGVDRVRERLQKLKEEKRSNEKRAEERAGRTPGEELRYQMEARKEADEQKREERRKRKHAQKSTLDASKAAKEAKLVEDLGIDPSLHAAFGFTSFGSKK